MPITTQKFQKDGQPVQHANGAKVQEKVLAFLKENKESAYTRKEVQEALGLKHPASTNNALKKLSEKNDLTRKEVEGTIYYHVVQTK